jgi:hypothetical protein
MGVYFQRAGPASISEKRPNSCKWKIRNINVMKHMYCLIKISIGVAEFFRHVQTEVHVKNLEKHIYSGHSKNISDKGGF